ncbi:MAG: polysaccharide pyruvyl transferase family protein [Verrucomicrobiota bacterium]
MAADYANLGDVALTRALIRFAGQHLPSHRLYLLCAGHVFHDLRGVARAADKDDMVAILGGGNMGDRYPDLEEARCHLVRTFRHSRIVSFPQSFDFSDTPAGRRALCRSGAAYSSHPRLRLFAREAESFGRMREAFPSCRVDLAPDTVLSLDLAPSARRNLPLLVCLRQDRETCLGAERRAAILDALREFAPDAVVTDTTVPGPRLGFPEYGQHLDALWANFARAKCVVTDRLHGLIFSVISRTPCVVIENNNHKIRSTWETWLSGLPSVRLLSDPEPVTVIAAVREIREAVAPPAPLNGAFAPLAQALRQ